ARAVAPGLRHEDDLVDAGILVAPKELAHLVGRPDCAPQRPQALLEQLGAPRLAGLRRGLPAEPEQVALLLELVPHVGPARLMRPEHVVMAQAEAEEVGAVQPP